MTAPFRKGDDVAAVEHDAGKPLEHGQVLYATVTEVRPLSVAAMDGAGDEWYFMIDREGHPWCEGGRWRLVPACAFCDMPVTGDVVVTPWADPEERKWCSEECLTASDEAAGEQYYPSGVAT